MNIKKVTIQIGLSGPDLITLYTDLPQPIYPFDATDAYFTIQAANGRGVDYAKDHFSKYKIEVLNHKSDSPKWFVINKGDKNIGECINETPKDYACPPDCHCDGNCRKFQAKL